MSELADHARRQAVLFVVAVLAAACLVAPAAADGSRARPPQRWAGYAIPANGDAAGGWIGGYRVGTTKLFLTTPTRRPNRAGLESPHEIGDLPGRAASRAETARAAWILSKYGAYRDATQAAAVDATVYHLLVGRAWRITRPRGARRIRQSGDPASVARFARIMLRQSKARAGRYTAELTTSSADLGGTVAVTLSVTDGHGRPASGLPVTLAMAGASSAPTVTGDDGRAVARFAAGARGWQDVTATVSQVPEHRLHTWAPEKKGQAAAAEGGARRTLVVTGRAAVRGPQSLSLKASPETLTVGGPARVVATVAGDGGPRTATASLFGPFSSAGAAQCTGAAVATVTAQVAADGAYALPPVVPDGGGYFVWRVAIDGTATSVPATSCGAVVTVRGKPTVTVGAPTPAQVGDNVHVGVSVGNMPFPMKVDLTLKLYGPGDTSCDSSIDDVDFSLVGNGQTLVGPILVGDYGPGTYYWQVEAKNGDLWQGATSLCGAPGSTTQVN